MPQETIDACAASDAVFLGAVGADPGVTEETHPGINKVMAAAALGDLRRELDLRISIRGVWRNGETPMLVVRNLLGGAYGGSNGREESIDGSDAVDVIRLEEQRVREVAEIAVAYAKRFEVPLLSVDKDSLFATSRLWRRVAEEIAAAHDVPVRHVLVDRMGFELANRDLPAAVMLTEGIFGDILSDVACGRAGSPALADSASICPRPVDAAADEHRCYGLFEPVHGSAPRRARQDVINPIGGYLALAALFASFAETEALAPRVRLAVQRTIADGAVTYDLAAPGATPRSTTQAILALNDNLRRELDRA